MPEARRLAQAGSCSVLAPAGCGKTELIARAIASNGAGRSLVLTHTHAGVKALRDRLKRYRIDGARARVDTIAGWCLRYTCSYPARSGLDLPMPTGAQWDEVYRAASRLLEISAVRSVVRASYTDVFVDEYQDCNLSQHEVILKLARLLPCRVLGDPMQGIFSFAGQTVRWGQDVLPTFPQLLELNTPWRWLGRNELLGQWLLQIRGPLSRGETINLSNAPLTWGNSSPEAQRQQAIRLSHLEGSVIALRKWPNASHDFARSMGGIYRSMEEMECSALVALARDLPALRGPQRVRRILLFASDCMTGLREGIATIWAAAEADRHPDLGRLRINQELATLLIEMSESGDPSLLLEVSRRLEGVRGVRLFRRELWREFQHTVSESAGRDYAALSEVAWVVRNRHRFAGRTVDRRAASRTLLVKGLECDHALVLDLDEYENARNPGEGAKNVYVAMTRGAVSLTVLSANDQVRFTAPLL